MDEPLGLKADLDYCEAMRKYNLAEREAFLKTVVQPFLDNFAAEYGLTRGGLTLDRDLRFINHSDER